MVISKIWFQSNQAKMFFFSWIKIGPVERNIRVDWGDKITGQILFKHISLSIDLHEFFVGLVH